MRRPGSAAAGWFAFLLLPLSLGVVLWAESVRAEGEASLLRAQAWLRELDERAAALRAMPELRLARTDRERLRALAALLRVSSDIEEAAGEERTFPWKLRVFRLMRRSASVDRMEYAVHGLDLLVRAAAEPGTSGKFPAVVQPSIQEEAVPGGGEETPAALDDYLRCVRMLADFETLEPEMEETVVRAFGGTGRDSLENASGNDGGEEPEEGDAHALRQDALLVALDAALAHELPHVAARPLLVIKAGLLLEQARPQAALQALDGVENVGSASDAAPGERRLRAQGLYLRSLALMRSGNFVLAGRDLDRALALFPDDAELRLARGTLLRMKGETGAMCGDFYAACAGGMCDGLKVAREQGYCGAGSVSDSPETGTLERTR